MKQEKKPILFFQVPEALSLTYYCFKFKAGMTGEALSIIKKCWKESFPETPMNNYFFLDDKFKMQYEDDKRFGIISGIFSLLTVILACTGLFMLSLFNVLKRTKEIGIRKSNGATSFQIIILFMKNYLYLVIIAYIISAPVSYLIMNKWLMNYPYRITMGLWFFLIPLVIILFISISTVYFHVLRAARTNPVETLRYE